MLKEKIRKEKEEEEEEERETLTVFGLFKFIPSCS